MRHGSWLSFAAALSLAGMGAASAATLPGMAGPAAHHGQLRLAQATGTNGGTASGEDSSGTADMRTGTDGNTTSPGSGRGRPGSTTISAGSPSAGSGAPRTGTDGNSTSPGSSRGGNGQ